MKIKLLAQEGVTKTKIAERLGISRQTAYNHLNRSEPFPKSRKARASKLDPFRDYIRARLERFDLPATVLFRELAEMGYTGGLSILWKFVRSIKAGHIQRVTERFETLLGQQAQIDLGECGTVRVDGEVRKLYVFVLVMGYSRMMYGRFTISTRLPAFLDCLSRGLRLLGIPAEILVGNMKQAVEEHDVTTGTERWNKSFLDLAEHFAFLPVASPQYWPRVKGKVERGVGYLRTSFLEGRAFTDLDDLNHQLQHWLDKVANARIHGTTGEAPALRHQHELTRLRPAAPVPSYDVRSVEIRKVAPDCHFSFEGTRHSAPPEAAGHTVTVRPSGDRAGDRLAAYLGEALLVEHRRAPRDTRVVTLSAHQEAVRRLTQGDPARARSHRGKQPAFEQVDGTTSPLSGALKRAAPAVQVGSLDDYERLVQRSA